MLKWNIKTRIAFKRKRTDIVDDRGKIIARAVPSEFADEVVAAHNAAVDMAFDSPGNVR